MPENTEDRRVSADAVPRSITNPLARDRRLIAHSYPPKPQRFKRVATGNGVSFADEERVNDRGTAHGPGNALGQERRATPHVYPPKDPPQVGPAPPAEAAIDETPSVPVTRPGAQPITLEPWQSPDGTTGGTRMVGTWPDLALIDQVAIAGHPAVTIDGRTITIKVSNGYAIYEYTGADQAGGAEYKLLNSAEATAPEPEARPTAPLSSPGAGGSGTAEASSSDPSSTSGSEAEQPMVQFDNGNSINPEFLDTLLKLSVPLFVVNSGVVHKAILNENASSEIEAYVLKPGGGAPPDVQAMVVMKVVRNGQQFARAVYTDVIAGADDPVLLKEIAAFEEALVLLADLGANGLAGSPDGADALKATFAAAPAPAPVIPAGLRETDPNKKCPACQRYGNRHRKDCPLAE